MSRLHLPELWFRALFAGFESAVLSWLIAVVPGLVTYVATAAAPGLGDASWQSAAGVSSAWWRTAFGGAFPVGEEGFVSLMPLGLTFVTILLLRGSIRRAGLRTAGEAASAVFGFVALAMGLSAVGGGPGRDAVGLVAVGAVAAVAALWGRTRELPYRLRVWLDGLPREIGRGFADGRALAWWVAGLGVSVVLAALVASWPTVWELHTALGPDAASSGVMALLQALYLPNLAAWALAWLAGPGFVVGGGTHYASTGVVTEALPAIPVLGALPAPGHEPGWWVALLLVALGALAGWWRGRRGIAPRDWTACGQRVAAAAATLLLVLFVLAWLSGGSIGPGRMVHIGVSPPLVAFAVTALVTPGYAAVVLARHALAVRAERLEAGAGDDDRPDSGDAPTRGGPDGVRTAETVATAATGATAPTAATAAVAPSAATAAVAPSARTPSDAEDDTDAAV